MNARAVHVDGLRIRGVDSHSDSWNQVDASNMIQRDRGIIEGHYDDVANAHIGCRIGWDHVQALQVGGIEHCPCGDDGASAPLVTVRALFTLVSFSAYTIHVGIANEVLRSRR
jgi:hypothetical protein